MMYTISAEAAMCYIMAGYTMKLNEIKISDSINLYRNLFFACVNTR